MKSMPKMEKRGSSKAMGVNDGVQKEMPAAHYTKGFKAGAKAGSK